MDTPIPRDWQTLYATAILDAENGQPAASIEGAELAILTRLREVVGSCSASEESELYAALRKLQGVRAHVMTAA